MNNRVLWVGGLVAVAVGAIAIAAMAGKSSSPSGPPTPTQPMFTPGHRYRFSGNGPIPNVQVMQFTLNESIPGAFNVVSLHSDANGNFVAEADYLLPTSIPISGWGPAITVVDEGLSPNPAPPPLPTPPPPPPPPPTPGNPQWVPATSIDPGKMYRISVPGDPVTTALITQALVNTNMGPIYPPNTLLPPDWPASDTHDPSRWRAQFTNTTGATVPIPPTTGGVYIFVAQ